MATPRMTGQSGKKTTIPPKPSSAQKIAQLDQFVTGPTPEPKTLATAPDSPPPVTPSPTTPSPITPITPELLPTELEKAKIKRLTLDISEDLHKSIKMQSVSLGVPMVDMLRKLLESNYGNS